MLFRYILPRRLATYQQDRSEKYRFSLHMGVNIVD
jgi:hypothetical protein